MESPVGGIFVFLPAAWTHRKRRHARERPVVRHVADDCQARTAVGAIDEGVEVAPVARREELARAIIAQRDVGRHRLELAGLGDGCADLERRISDRGNRFPLEVVDVSQRRCFGTQSRCKFLKRGTFALYADFHCPGSVGYPTTHVEPPGKVENEWSEADALDGPANADSSCVHAALAPPANRRKRAAPRRSGTKAGKSRAPD
jgi:hypothetical protein